jgi:hypothetical protein
LASARAEHDNFHLLRISELLSRQRNWQQRTFALQIKTTAMTKSMIILLGVIWLICTLYLGFARMYDYPYKAAMAVSWASSAALLVCIILFIRKHRRNK